MSSFLPWSAVLLQKQQTLLKLPVQLLNSVNPELACATRSLSNQGQVFAFVPPPNSQLDQYQRRMAALSRGSCAVD